MKKAATIGFFDGVHRGHRFLLRSLLDLSAEHCLEPLVVTFRQHPAQVLRVDSKPLLLNYLQERVDRIKAVGIKQVEVLDFVTIQKLTAKEFMQQLIDNGVELLLMGYDHRFGSDLLSSHEQYQNLASQVGLRIEFIDEYKQIGQHISSTEIRRLISQGNISQANDLLGYNYCLEGKVVSGNHVGRTIGFPTANIQTDPIKLIPKAGVYYAVANYNDKNYKTLLNIGNNPTINGQKQTIEAHLLDFDKDIYGKKIKLQIVERLRDEIKFDSLEQLREQILKDKQRISK